ncbi:MAG: hypothetical protein MUC60_09930 [Oscillatoria sp. Prado101]|jgi:hypothetical protein|nr:hypothetical protein [Oscillatoria sp. Prado101]
MTNITCYVKSRGALVFEGGKGFRLGFEIVADACYFYYTRILPELQANRHTDCQQGRDATPIARLLNMQMRIPGFIAVLGVVWWGGGMGAS